MDNSILNFEKFSPVTPEHLKQTDCKDLNVIYYQNDNKTIHREGRIIKVYFPNRVIISFRNADYKKSITLFLPNPRLVFGTNYSLNKRAEPIKAMKEQFDNKVETFLINNNYYDQKAQETSVYNHYYRTNMSNIKLVSLLSEVIKRSNAQYALIKEKLPKEVEVDDHKARSIFNYHLGEILKYPTYQFWKSFQEWPKPVPIVHNSQIVNLYTEHPQIKEVLNQIDFKSLLPEVTTIASNEKIIDEAFDFTNLKNFSFI